MQNKSPVRLKNTEPHAERARAREISEMIK